MILFAGVRWKTLVVLGAVVTLGAVAVWPHLKPYQRKRVETFLNPEGDVLGAGYHATQSMIAVGSGQGLGKGWGQGTQTLLSFLPEQHTDFIFSVIGEELGLVGVTILTALFVLLIIRGFQICFRARDPFGIYLSLGITVLIAIQTLLNMGVVLGLLPTKGSTLPFISYGGTSLMVNLMAVGILLNIHSQGGRAGHESHDRRRGNGRTPLPGPGRG
jgi:rod shape determining protein RodA